MMTEPSFEPGKKGRVIEAYQATTSHPLAAFAGEKLTLGKLDAQWPGWAWCTNWQDQGGWVPESLLAIEGDSGTLRRDYTARELSVSVGDLLTLRELESGWYWASDPSGKTGWVPAANVEILDET